MNKLIIVLNYLRTLLWAQTFYSLPGVSFISAGGGNFSSRFVVISLSYWTSRTWVRWLWSKKASIFPRVFVLATPLNTNKTPVQIIFISHLSLLIVGRTMTIKVNFEQVQIYWEHTRITESARKSPRTHDSHRECTKVAESALGWWNECDADVNVKQH